MKKVKEVVRYVVNGSEFWIEIFESLGKVSMKKGIY